MKFVTTLLFALSSALPMLARDLYVSNDGVASGNGSQAAPFTTIQEALNAAQAGDRIKVGRGKYNEKLSFPRSGRPGSPIVLEGGSSTILSGKTLAGGTLLHIHGKSHITIEQVRFQHMRPPGGTFVQIEGACSDVRIRNCYFGSRLSVDTVAVDVIGNDRRPIKNLLLDDLFTAELRSNERGAISVSGNVSGFLIKNSNLAETIGFGIKVQATRDGFPHDGTIERNRLTPFYRANPGKLPPAIYLDGARNIRAARNNVIFFGTAIEVAAERPGSLASDVTITRNRIDRNVFNGVAIGNGRSEGTIRDCLVIDNWFRSNAAKGSKGGQVTVRGGMGISILRNQMAVERTASPLLVSDSQAKDVTSDYNRFRTPDGSTAIFLWEERKFSSLDEFQQSTGQDEHSKIARTPGQFGGGITIHAGFAD